LATFDFRQTLGVRYTPEAALSFGDLISNVDWGGPFENWTVQGDGSLRIAVSSSDQTKSLMIYLDGWRSLSGGKYEASELLFAYTDGLGSGTLSQKSARYSGNLTIKSDLSSVTGTVTGIEENENNQEYSYLSGSWEMSKLSNPNVSQAFDYIVSGSDVFTGSAYDDRIEGRAGNDNIIGGAGNDFLAGGIGDDIITGSDGNDQISDASGLNYLNGGAGSDRFYIQITGSSGRWQRTHSGTYWDIRSVKRRVGGKLKRVNEFFVDNNVDIIEDFSLSEDSLYVRGSGAVYDPRPEGIQIWDQSETNVISFIAGMTESQYLNLPLYTW
jgi:Ca2+-binding RTX toxin-like protein